MGFLTCSSCGVRYSLPDHMEKARREDHDTFWCPNGHGQHFPGKTEKEKRIEALELEIFEDRKWHHERFRELVADRDAERALARTCPMCGEKPAARLRVQENVLARMADHLRDEHGARTRLRSLPPGESVSAS